MHRVRSLIRRKLLDLGFKPESKKKESEREESQWTDKEVEKLLQTSFLEKKLSEADYNFLNDSFNLAKKETSIEKEYENHLAPLINEEPIWKEWLMFVNGISTRNTCRLLRYFGYCEVTIFDKETNKIIGMESGDKKQFEKALELYNNEEVDNPLERRYIRKGFDTISKLWAYSGLAVKDGKSIRRKKGEQLNFNLKIKTGVVGVIGDCLIKSNKSYKKEIYDTYKERIQKRGCCQEKHKKHKGKMCKDYPGHSARMAQRKMVKIFLSHYWLKCRELKKLPTRNPYPHKDDNGYSKPFYDKNPDEV